eukprot:INCI13967.1.p1 GENE.INCI13967.1~~INCI13967.1.p1  ORF type:complete len:446 (-),score=86.22 INCI13967.1:56-1393(-)
MVLMGWSSPAPMLAPARAWLSKKIGKAFDNIVDAKRVCREIKLLRHLEHENLMSIIDIVQPPSFDLFSDVYIVSPLMETDLHRIIYSRQDLTDDHVQYFVYQILRGLKYMHSANVIHRDLKPSNILLNSNCDLKICDFGLARGLEEIGMLTEYVVTRWYRAPEIMLSCQEYSKAVDVWSVGCIFAELVGRRPLFAGDDYIHQLQIITDVLGSPSDDDMHFITSHKALRFMQNMRQKELRPFSTLYPRANPEALKLLTEMLLFDPAKRIDVVGALAHPYMDSLHCEEDEPECEHSFSHKVSKHARVNDLKLMVFADIVAFHPEASGELDAATAQVQRAPATAFPVPGIRAVGGGVNGGSRETGGNSQRGGSSGSILPANGIGGNVHANGAAPQSQAAHGASEKSSMPPISGAMGSGIVWNEDQAHRPSSSASSGGYSEQVTADMSP